MGFLNKIKNKVAKGLRKVGLSHRASKVVSRFALGDAAGTMRALQRSHKLGRFGHTLAPSTSSSNYITAAYGKLMKCAAKAGEKMAARMSNSASVLGKQVSMPQLSQQRLNYKYRRLSDIS